jgi:hypothetical protein
MPPIWQLGILRQVLNPCIMIGLWVENGDTDRARKQPADHERHEWAANAGGANIPKFGMPNAHSGHNKLYMPPNPLGPIVAEERTRTNYIIVNCAYEDRNLQQQSAYGLLARKGWPTRYADALMLKSSIAWCKLRWIDSALFIWFYRRCPRILDAISIVRPETMVRCHRKGIAAHWRWKAQRARTPVRRAGRLPDHRTEGFPSALRSECLAAYSVAAATQSRSPGVSSAAFRAQSPNLRFAPLMDMDFTVRCPLVRCSRLVFGFCPSTRAFA